MLTTSQAVTKIVRARVIVVTSDGRPDAYSRLAVVPDGTGIAIQAFTGIEFLVAATRITATNVLRARIAVVAKGQEFAAFFVGLIRKTVAIVILSVTFFCRGHGRVTRA